MKFQNFFFGSVLFLLCSHDLWAAAAAVDDPIFGIIKTGNRDALQNYLKQNPSAVHARDRDGKAPMHYVFEIEIGRQPLVAIMIRAGADMNAKDRNDDRPLHYALKNPDSYYDVMQLLQSNARPLSKNKQGVTPLHLVTKNKKDRELRYLIQAFPELIKEWINIEDDKGRTPLMYAITQPENGEVLYLLDRNGANLQHRDLKGFDLLDFALFTQGNKFAVEDVLRLDVERNLNLDPYTERRLFNREGKPLKREDNLSPQYKDPEYQGIVDQWQKVKKNNLLKKDAKDLAEYNVQISKIPERSGIKKSIFDQDSEEMQQILFDLVLAELAERADKETNF